MFLVWNKSSRKRLSWTAADDFTSLVTNYDSLIPNGFGKTCNRTVTAQEWKFPRKFRLCYKKREYFCMLVTVKCLILLLVGAEEIKKYLTEDPFKGMALMSWLNLSMSVGCRNDGFSRWTLVFSCRVIVEWNIVRCRFDYPCGWSWCWSFSCRFFFFMRNYLRANWNVFRCLI